MRDTRFDEPLATDTGGFVEVADMADVTSANLDRAIRYEPTRAEPFRRMLRDVRPATGGVFVDIGCGKGRTLLLAAEYGFRRVAGVDFSPSLCETARRNLEAFRTRSGLDFDATVTHADATEFEFTSHHTVVFLYNPFDATVLGTVMDNLDASLDRSPRRLWLIYHNPLWRDEIDGRERYREIYCRRLGGLEFVVYECIDQGSRA